MPYVLPAVPALLPLSLLEAIRNLDTPVEDGLDELAEEIVVRRLGLSPTVAAQIQRYRATAERDGTVELDEVVSRDPAGGAPAGRAAGVRRRRPPGGALRGPLARPLGADAGAGVARGPCAADRAPGGGPPGPAGSSTASSARRPQGTEVRMTDPLSILAMPDGAACAFYGSAYGELLRCLTAFEGAMLHERCRARGDEACVWRTAAAEVYE